MAETFGLILLHGSGDSGLHFYQWISCFPSFKSKLGSKQFKYRYPSARPIPYTLAGRIIHSVWHDRLALSPDAPEDTEGVLSSIVLIDAEIDEFIKEGIPVERIFVLGMSMGGHMALQMAVRSKHAKSLAGVVALSCFLSTTSPAWDIYSARRGAGLRIPPICIVHGDSDRTVSPRCGRDTAERLAAILDSENVKFSVIPRLEHDMNDKEIDCIADWVQSIISLSHST